MVDVLRDMKLEPSWDQDIGPGMAFSDAIRAGIANAHVFMPLITENSQKRPWVHQETGYAMGINVPVLPVAVGNLPGEMIAQLQAITVLPDFSDLTERLKETHIEQVVHPPPQGPLSMFKVADWAETRAEMIARDANRVIDLGKYGLVRHRGSMTSFSLPDKDINDPIWMRREGTHPQSFYFRHLLREERRALERHARVEGCTLIVDPTVETLNQLGPDARRARLEILLEFLESFADDKKVRIIISSRAGGGSLIIVGDWFVAESLVRRPTQGYRQTVFSSHAPTVLRAFRRFDDEFNELCKSSGLEPDDSRRAAVEKIKEIIGALAGGGGAGIKAGDRIPLPRVLEPEAMNTPEEARAYDAMDHAAVDAQFVADFRAEHGPCRGGELLDVGTGPAKIPIALCRADPQARVLGIDLADPMLDRARRNVEEAGLSGRIRCEWADAKVLHHPDGTFEAVLCNTIVHHIPEPARILKEMARVVAPGGTLFVRDLVRPDSLADVARLVAKYAGAESSAARKLFEASLHAALTLGEVRALVRELGRPEDRVEMMSDRHWTWIRKGIAGEDAEGQGGTMKEE
jgi:ubiquinone/menaquinone biosynthesis C-methylase UbiE